jgi:hypothetical protein
MSLWLQTNNRWLFYNLVQGEPMKIIFTQTLMFCNTDNVVAIPHDPLVATRQHPTLQTSATKLFQQQSTNWRTETANQRWGSEYELIKIVFEEDRGSNKMNTASNTRLWLNYPSWSRPRSHWSATNPRNQQTTFRAKSHQHTQRKLARLAACATPVRPMACAGQTGDTGQTSGQSRSGRLLQQPHNKCSREPQWLL